jgi:AcrR family transcriptional regulator
MQTLNDSGRKKRTRPKRGAPAKGEPTARERILATAMDLFYREGIQTTGVDTIVERSGVSKTSLYRTFASKDDLIAAVAGEQNRLYWAGWEATIARAPDDARGRLQAVLAGVARQITGPSYRGCPFINTATEFRDDSHPGRMIARANKEELRKRLGDLCRQMGTRNPARLGSRLALLINGAYASGLVTDVTAVEADLIKSASALIDRELPG